MINPVITELAIGFILGIFSMTIVGAVAVALDEHDNRWIPCSERLPEVKINPVTNNYVKYNVTVKIDDVVDVRYYSYGVMNGEEHWLYGPAIMDELVVAWQPLPDPYQTKGE